MADTPDFQFLRKVPVDLSRYLPAFLSHDPAFSDALNVLSKEHESQRLALIDTAKQAFVETATWGLESWEQMLGIPTNTKLRYTDRRQTIRQKLQGADTVTKEFLTKLLNLYLADRQGDVIDYPEKYEVIFRYHGGQVFDYTNLRTAIRTYLPAHLGYKLSTLTQAKSGLKCFGIARQHNVVKLKVQSVATTTVQPTSLRAVVFISHSRKVTKIQGGITNGNISEFNPDV